MFLVSLIPPTISLFDAMLLELAMVLRDGGEGEAAGRAKAGLALIQYEVIHNFKTGCQYGHIFISYKI